jgi:hypothetical protein
LTYHDVCGAMIECTRSVEVATLDLEITDLLCCVPSQEDIQACVQLEH